VTILAYVCLLLPGLAWWAWLGRRQEDPLISLAKVIGISLSLIILLAKAGFILGVRFSPILIAILMSISALLATGGLIRKGFRIQRRYRLHLGIGLLLLALAMTWRLYQARDLLLPNWVDSQHHFLIIQAILEHGGIPEDLLPYLPVPFYYHFGYHAVAALFTAISGLPIGQAMLSLGQVLNALVGLSAYVLGKSLWRNWRPALAAALLISFATRMPAYYLSWGRYTLTVGLIILPLAMALALDMVRGKTDWYGALSLGLLTAGLLLTHYFAVLLLGAFIGLLALIQVLRGTRRLPETVLRISWMLNSAAAGLLLALPWLWRVAKYTSSSAAIKTNLPESVGVIFTSARWGYIWQLLGPASNHWLLVPAGIGLVLVLIKRHNLGFALWSLVLALMSLPTGVTLGPFRADHFAIVLFLPVTLLVGWLSWLAAQWVGRQLKQTWVTSIMLILMVMAWVGWGLSSTWDIVNPTTVLVNEADLEALAWVAENTPAEARFYINTAYWLANAYRGVDGGGWLLPYTGRWALVPTVFYGYSPDAAWVGKLRSWGEAASQITSCTPGFWSLVESAELDWIYLRTGVGSLQPSGLADCDGVRLAFQNESVSIYQLDNP
jgi:hypothetical protein